MSAGKVDAWWVVATAATLIAVDLAASPASQAQAFFAFCVLLAPITFLLWFISGGMK